MKHIYIGGAGRSGTTLLGSSLMSIPGAVATPESHFKFDLLTDPAKHVTDPKFKLWNVERPSGRGGYREILEGLVLDHAKVTYSDIDSVEYWVDHTPSNVLYGCELLRAVPDSYFLNIIRDPRAVFASVRKLDWGGTTPSWVSSTWLQYVASGLALEKMFPDRVLTLRYEDYVLDPDSAFLSIRNKFSLPLCDLSYDRYKLPGYTTHQHRKVGSPPTKSSLDKWKEVLSDKEISIVETACRSTMQALGYQVVLTPLGASVPMKIVMRDFVVEVFSYLYKSRRHKRKID